MATFEKLSLYIYTDEDIEHFGKSKQLAKFIERKAAASIKTASAYKTALPEVVVIIHPKAVMIKMSIY